MDKQTFPTLDQERWTIADKNFERTAEDRADAWASESAAPAAVHGSDKNWPVSAVMQRNVPVVDAEATVDQLERVLTEQNLVAVAVKGSNGVIVGVIGARELAQFANEKKNAKAVRVWEISRCTMFEVGPDESIEAVAAIMADHKFDYISVTDVGEFKGLVLAQELVNAILQKNAERSIAGGTSDNHTLQNRRHDD